MCRAVLGILYLLIYPNVIDLAIDLPSEEAMYPILSVSCELLCIHWNEPQAATCITQAAFQQARLEYKLVDAHRGLPRYPQGQSRTCYQ